MCASLFKEVSPFSLWLCSLCTLLTIVTDTQVMLSQIDIVAGSDNFERTIFTFDRNFSTHLISLLDRIMDFSVTNCEHKLMNILYRFAVVVVLVVQ